jgi:glycosyltransferase involved in cell wall biosynthesis
MRILLLCNKSPWPPKDGGSSATLNLIRGLSAMNVEVSVLALNTEKHHSSINIIPEEIQNNIDIQLIDLNTNIKPLKLIINLFLSEKPYNLERFLSEEFRHALINKLRNRFDVIQIEGLAMHHYLPVIRQHSKATIVYRPHNIENLIWTQLADRERNLFKSRYFRILAHRIEKIENTIINECDGLVPISDKDTVWLRSKGLAKPFNITAPGFNPIELVEYEDHIPPRVFFIGSLDWLPNIDGLYWFIKMVWPLVINGIHEAEFHIAGRNPSPELFKGFKGQNIFFAGEVESSADFIKENTIMIAPLFSGSGIRIKIIEGMSYGKCIVATPIAAEGLVYEHNSNILISSDPEEFADYITRLILDPVLRKKLGENALKNVRKNYNILASAEKLVNFYSELSHDN